MIQQDMLYRVSLNYIKKERFTGSFLGTRYMLEKKEKEEENVILTCVWEEPYCFEKTEEEKKEYMEFPLSEEGLAEALKWIGEKQDERQIRQNES